MRNFMESGTYLNMLPSLLKLTSKLCTFSILFHVIFVYCQQKGKANNIPLMIIE